MINQYSFAEGLSITKLGTENVLRWMQRRRETLKIQNVEDDRAFQRHDIDFIWITRKNVNLVEIKVDRYETGNFFFEILSNKERSTPGCFMYTKATLLLYYFNQSKSLYILPMPATRDWFLTHRASFYECSTQTKIGEGHYTTVGVLVPINRVVEEVIGVWCYQLSP